MVSLTLDANRLQRWERCPGQIRRLAQTPVYRPELVELHLLEEHQRQCEWYQAAVREKASGLCRHGNLFDIGESSLIECVAP